jgi:hypothetical protein
MKADHVPFWPDELEELQKANAIRQRIRAARNKRQELHNRTVERNRLAALERANEVAAARRAARDKFDAHATKVLLALSRGMEVEGLVMVVKDAQFGENRIPVFTLSDGKLQYMIYWVYGKGFEWGTDNEG